MPPWLSPSVLQLDMREPDLNATLDPDDGLQMSQGTARNWVEAHPDIPLPQLNGSDIRKT